MADTNTGKNAAAVALGRLGGLKGGKERANSLTPKRRAAIAKKAAAELESFLKNVEPDVRAMGFEPVLVLNAAFDTKERREFARRLTTGYRLENNKLKGVGVLRAGQVWSHDPVHGDCRVIPERGVVLVVTDKQRAVE